MNLSKFEEIMKSTKDPRFTGTIVSAKKFFSLSNDVYQIDYENGSSFVLKLEDPKNINYLTFYKKNVLSLINTVGYGKDIFLFQGNHIEIEKYIKSKSMEFSDFIDNDFKKHLMKNLTEFNSISFNNGKENFWNIIKQNKIIENCVESIRLEIPKFAIANELMEGNGVWMDNLWKAQKTNNLWDGSFEGLVGNPVFL